MTLDVDPAELRSAAKKLSAAAGPLACRVVSSAELTEEKVGHVELTGWVNSVLEHCREANTKLSNDASAMAADLRATADDFEARDQEVKVLFDPSQLNGPFGNGPLGNGPLGNNPFTPDPLLLPPVTPGLPSTGGQP